MMRFRVCLFNEENPQKPCVGALQYQRVICCMDDCANKSHEHYLNGSGDKLYRVTSWYVEFEKMHQFSRFLSLYQELELIVPSSLSDLLSLPLIIIKTEYFPPVIGENPLENQVLERMLINEIWGEHCGDRKLLAELKATTKGATETCFNQC